jgi:hypothetical protein
LGSNFHTFDLLKVDFGVFRILGIRRGLPALPELGKLFIKIDDFSAYSPLGRSLNRRFYSSDLSVAFLLVRLSSATLPAGI